MRTPAGADVMPRIVSLRPRISAYAGSRIRALPKDTEPFYGSDAHKAWRAAVISRANRRCEECGSSGSRLYADHIIALKDGGDPTGLLNGQALCPKCHGRKSYLEKRKREGRLAGGR
jgi:5-methylcytosine-specific restriction protein A